MTEFADLWLALCDDSERDVTAQAQHKQLKALVKLSSATLKLLGIVAIKLHTVHASALQSSDVLTPN
jgi:hypothetical protein